MILQACQQGGDVVVVPARGGGAVHKGFGVQIVGVHQAGVEHPGEKRLAVCVRGGAGRKCRQGDFALPAVIRFQRALQPPQQGGTFGGVGAGAAVRQTAVMPGNGEGDFCPASLPRLLRPGGGMIHLGAAPQPTLKPGAVLADIVQFCRCIAVIGSVKGGGKPAAKCCRTQKMLGDSLRLCAVAADMRKRGGGDVSGHRAASFCFFMTLLYTW